jgi:hypothetical protein
MTAIRIWVRAVLRQRWRATIVLSLLIGIAGAAAIGAADGARRTQTAFTRMREVTHGADLLVSPGGTGLQGFFDELARQPEILRAGELAGVPLAVYNKSGQPDPSAGPLPNAALDDKFGFSVQAAKIIEGRMFDPDAVDEAIVDPKAAASGHLRVGSSLPMALGTSGDGEPPTWAPVTIKIVGIGVTQDDVVATSLLGEQPLITLTPAFFRSQPTLRKAFDLKTRQQAVVNYEGVFLKLRPGTDIPAFEKRATEIASKYPLTFGTFFENLAQSAERVQHAIVPLAIALYAFAGLIAVALLFVLGQAIARQQFVEADDFWTLRALGFTRAQVVGASLSRVSVVVLSGTILAVAGALPVSLFMPIGPARVAETHTGFELNVAIVGLGAAALFVLLMARALAPALRAAVSGSSAMSAPARTSVLADAAARAGLAPPLAAGVRMAFEQRRGSRSLPLRSALAGSIVGLAALTAALMFASSLNRLVTVPAQYGQRWDVIADSSFGILPFKANEASMRADPDLAAYTVGNYGSLVIDHQDVPAVGLTAIKGVGDSEVYPRLLQGRPAQKPDEIVLGTTQFRRLKTALNRTIIVQFPLDKEPRQMRVVGRAVFPTLGRGSFTPASLGDGAAVIADDFADLEKVFNEGATESNNFVLIKFRPGADRRAVEKRLSDRFVDPECAATNDCTILHELRPIELGVLTRVRSVPLILAGLLALFAVATLGHALLTSVRLRAHDLAILKTIGFVRRQIRATVAWQTSALGITTLLFGLPLGIIGGRAIWALFANDLGVPPDAALSVVVILIAIPATLILANVIGAFPARAAARTEAAVVLRTE